MFFSLFWGLEDPDVGQTDFILRPLCLTCWWQSFCLNSLSLIFTHICVLISSSSKDTSHIGLEATHVTSVYFHCLIKSPASKQSHILKCWEVGRQHLDLGRTIHPITMVKDNTLPYEKDKARISILTTLFNIVMEGLVISVRQGKEIKDVHIEKEE